MGWAVIIVEVLRLFGPLLLKWLEELLNQAAASLPAPAFYGNDLAATEALYDRAAELVPWYRWVRRAMVRRMKTVNFRAMREGRTKLTAAEIKEVLG